MEMRMELKQAVAAYQMGNVNAFTQLYEESKNYIYVCVHKIMNGTDNLYYAMCDIMNETYLEISQNINQLQDVDKFLSWAGTIATRKSLDYLRKNNNYVLLQDDEVALDNIFDSDDIIPETVLQDREKQRLVKEIIDNELTPMQKICVVSYYYNELKQWEIAENLGVPESTVKTHLSRAKVKIKDAVLDLEQNYDTRLYSAVPLFAFIITEEIMSAVVPQEVSKYILDYFAYALQTGMVQAGTAGVAGAGAAGQAGVAGAGVASEAGMAGTGAAGQAGAVGAVSQSGIAGTGAATAGMTGAGAAGTMGAVGGTAGGATAASIGAMASAGAKIGALTLKAKLAIAAASIVVVGGGGVVAYNIAQDNDKDDDDHHIETTVDEEDEVTTEAVVEEVTTEATTEVTTEMTTENTGEQTTAEGPIEPDDISGEFNEEELENIRMLAQYMGIAMEYTTYDDNIEETTIYEEEAWWFLWHMCNDNKPVSYDPLSGENSEDYIYDDLLPTNYGGMGLHKFKLEEIEEYLVTLFGYNNPWGLDGVNEPEPNMFYEQDGYYVFSGAQFSSNVLAKITKIEEASSDGEYKVIGVWCPGYYEDINQSAPTYNIEDARWFSLYVTPNPDSPFGFSVIDMSRKSEPVVTEEDLWGEGGVTGFGPHASLPDGQ